MKAVYFIAIITIIFSSFVAATGVFTNIEVVNDLNRVNLDVNLYLPPNISSTCNDVSSQPIPCTDQFDLLVPQILSQNGTNISLTDQRKWFFYNPEATANVDIECKKFSSGQADHIPMSINLSSKKITVNDSSRFSDVSFSWTDNATDTICYRYHLPVYNPRIANKSLMKQYPFDSYTVSIGFSFPYDASIKGVITLPEKYYVTNFLIQKNETEKNETEFYDKNIGYLSAQVYTNQTNIYIVSFERTPDWWNKFFIVVEMLALPFILIARFLSSKKQNEKIDSAGFYLAVVALLFSMYPFLGDKPNSTTLFDIVILTDIILLILNVFTDFITQDCMGDLKTKGYGWIIVCALLAADLIWYLTLV